MKCEECGFAAVTNDEREGRPPWRPQGNPLGARAACPCRRAAFRGDWFCKASTLRPGQSPALPATPSLGNIFTLATFTDFPCRGRAVGASLPASGRNVSTKRPQRFQDIVHCALCIVHSIVGVVGELLRRRGDEDAAGDGGDFLVVVGRRRGQHGLCYRDMSKSSSHHLNEIRRAFFIL